MLGYIEYLGIPWNVALAIVVALLVEQIVVEILKLKGMAIPEIASIRSSLARRKREKEAFRKMPDFIEKYEKQYDETTETLAEVQTLLRDVREHYSEDNIAKRDGWIQEVNAHIAESGKIRDEQNRVMSELAEKLNKNNADTLSLLIDSKRNFILDFTSKAADIHCPLTKEQYNRFFNVYREYEDIISENHMTNGQVEVAYEVVTRSYEERLKTHSFIEDGHKFGD